MKHHEDKNKVTSYLRLSVLTGLVVSTCAADRQSNRITGEIKFAVLDNEVAIAWNHLAYTHEKNGDYTPMTKPGDYQYTPAFDWVWKPDFSVARPFVLDSVSQFRSPPPPALKSAEYAEASVRSYFTGQPRAVINENEFELFDAHFEIEITYPGMGGGEVTDTLSWKRLSVAGQLDKDILMFEFPKVADLADNAGTRG